MTNNKRAEETRYARRLYTRRTSGENTVKAISRHGYLHDERVIFISKLCVFVRVAKRGLDSRAKLMSRGVMPIFVFSRYARKFRRSRSRARDHTEVFKVIFGYCPSARAASFE